MIKTIKCPLCGDVAIYKDIKNTTRESWTIKTHAWSCRECPFVGFEYYEDSNIESLYDL